MTTDERTQVVIVGAGPAGLLLSQLLHLAGVESVLLERRDREYCEKRVRAGVLEHQAADILREAGVGERMDREGLVHEGIELRFDGEGHRVPMTELTGRHITVYGQQEVVKDLIARRLGDGGDLRFEAQDLEIHDVGTAEPSVTYTRDGGTHRVVADVVAGCDGFHGPSRAAAGPAELLHHYPFAWLGILAHASPRTHELIYSLHERGFALYSMRSEQVTRLYLQVDADDTVDSWPHERIWDELAIRFSLDGEAWDPGRGEIFDVGITPMRSFVAEPMRRGRLLLAGDAAHIVPPTGAKGMNLAVHDVWLMARAIEHWYTTGDEALLESYSDDALRRVWRGEHFAWWMTSMLHRFHDEDLFRYRLQVAQLRNVVSSHAYATALAENYAG
ncbi:4-hydroxybenzoate 3-monooxygenase [Georgenia sp. AZ-5]|uniref:4-hydroxybenzoate 3-monooxygenase n=1 Tax=Georgenia sp. AZ-5 TaxID=3367526 RepID=UPI003754A0D0